MSNKELYTILEMEPTDNIKDIKRAYAMAIRKYHPEENADRECAKRAMLQTCDDIIMVKGNVYEDGYSFNIASSEQSIGNFSASFDRYLDILGDAIRHFGDLYHEYIGEKRGREQTLDSIQTGKMALDTTTAENKLLS